ncbi:N,O-diacetylmuramidase [Paracoccidioides lutzii Pb01]|uniref:N,O-diacetylmuramidase n=1 Tax=Paracoccidioides lutzii (strain ATCC MYA-826 / Pb01) TaxID=502779 RepID=C1H6J8_PARBA|nr:N,O-diacetylmuramidase [Paracoccidioides lutzii Pb01]EEH35342.2 N,O-diacetylmuramidase [Paracoccidioides lutzii Pb01]
MSISQAHINTELVLSSGCIHTSILHLFQFSSPSVIKSQTKHNYQATKGTNYTDPSFSIHYTSATKAGFIRAGYQFAHPDSAIGAAQTAHFLAHLGGLTGNGITLPGMLDIESNPNGSQCYELSASAMVSWILGFRERMATARRLAVGHIPSGSSDKYEVGGDGDMLNGDQRG